MKINEKQYDKIKHILPIQRGNVSVENIKFINALLYICENGCKWRRLPKEYGNWNAIYKRFRRWVDCGIIDKLFQELHIQDILEVNTEALFLDSTIVKVHSDASECLLYKHALTGKSLIFPRCARFLSGSMRSFKKSGDQSIGRCAGGLTTKIHFISANEKTAVEFTLTMVKKLKTFSPLSLPNPDYFFEIWQTLAWAFSRCARGQKSYGGCWKTM